MLDQKVIQDFKNGSLEAFDLIYDFYAKDIWLFCFRYTRSRESSEELVNDVFMRIWNKRESIDPEQGVKNYLYSISRSILHNWFETVSRSKRMQQLFEETSLSNYQEAKPDSVDAIIDLKTLKELLNSLPPRRREIYKMCKFDGMSYAELAEYFSITRDAVKDHVVKANKVLLNYNKTGEFYMLLLVLSMLY